MASNVVHLPRPNEEDMRRHLELMFGGAYPEAHSCKLQIAWTQAGKAAITEAQNFGVDEIEEAAAHAAKINATTGCNVYVVAGLLASSCAPFGRASDDDISCIPALYLDFDDAGAVQAAIPKYAHCKPTWTVSTGAIPYWRCHSYWKLDDPLRDLLESRRMLKGMALLLGADPQVFNPSRCLRLAGSVCYPTKPGRVIEQSRLIVPADNRPREFMREQIARAFNLVLPLAMPADHTPTTGAPAVQPATPAADAAGVAPDTDLFGRVDLRALRDSLRAGQWHNQMVRLVAALVSRGVPNEIINLMAPMFTLPGHTVAQTEFELRPLINSARQKFAIPNVEGGKVEAPPDDALTVADFRPPSPLTRDYQTKYPRRRWVLGTSLLEGYLSLLIANPGVGKSLLTLHRALAVATGRPITGQTVHQHAPAMVVNNEDDLAEIERRLMAAMDHHKIAWDEIDGRLIIFSGKTRRYFRVASRSGLTDAMVAHPDLAIIADAISTYRCKYVGLDPMITVHDGAENSNEDVQRVAELLSGLAARCACAIDLVHHTNKPPAAEPTAYIGNLYAGRGASSLVGVARFAETMFNMSEDDAIALNVPVDERHRYVRVDSAKANIALITGKASWFRRVSVTLANEGLNGEPGDDVGVLEIADLADNSATLPAEIVTARLSFLQQVAEILSVHPGGLSQGDLAEALHTREPNEAVRTYRKRLAQTIRTAPKATKVEVRGVSYNVYQTKEGKTYRFMAIVPP